jgi:hypothetical protein
MAPNFVLLFKNQSTFFRTSQYLIQLEQSQTRKRRSWIIQFLSILNLPKVCLGIFRLLMQARYNHHQSDF